MFGYELEGLKRLGVPCTKWGSNFRVKVLGRTKKMVYISDVSKPKNRELISKQYNISMKKLKFHLSPDYKGDSYYRFYQGKVKEAHLYENINPSDFYDRLETILSSQLKAFKINIALGYELESLASGLRVYWHPNLSNTNVFDKPIAVNSKADIRKKIISEIRTMELADRLNYPKSGYKLKGITGFKIYISSTATTY